MDIIEDLNKLEHYLINDSEISVKDAQVIAKHLIDIREKAINYTRCCGALKKEETAFDLWLKNFKKTTYGYWYDENTIYCREAMSGIYKNEVKPTL